MSKEYSFWKGVMKTILPMLIVAGPILVQMLPSNIANLTISGALLLLINYLKVKFS